MDLEEQTSSQTATTTATEVKTQSFEDVLHLEDLIRSEKEVKTAAPKLTGVTEVKNDISEDLFIKPFQRKEDEKKVHQRRKFKLMRAVYISVVCLLATLVCGNAITLAVLLNGSNSNAKTIRAKQQTIQVLEDEASTEDPTSPDSYSITINKPNDYGDEEDELTIFDKLSILFRSIFG